MVISTNQPPKFTTEVRTLSFEKKKKEGGNAARLTKIMISNQRNRKRTVLTKITLKASDVLKLSINIEKNNTTTPTKEMYEIIYTPRIMFK